MLAASALWTIGFLVGRPDACTGVCEWSSFTLIFGAAPVSALITVLGGSDLVIGWPVDMLAWLMLGVLQQRLSNESEPWSRPWTIWSARFLGVALIYGGLLALTVTRVRV